MDSSKERTRAALDEELRITRERSKAILARGGSEPKQLFSRPQLPPVAKAPKKIRGRDSRK